MKFEVLYVQVIESEDRRGAEKFANSYADGKSLDVLEIRELSSLGEAL